MFPFTWPQKPKRVCERIASEKNAAIFKPRGALGDECTQAV